MLTDKGVKVKLSERVVIRANAGTNTAGQHF